MIAKMNFVSITGPRGDIDRIVDKYLTRYEIHLEYAPSELKTVATLRPYIEQNIYRDQLVRMKELAEHMGAPDYENVDTDVKRAADKIDSIYDELLKYRDDIEEIDLNELLKDYITVEPLNLTPDNILDRVSEYYHLTVKEIKGASRSAQIVFARHVCMFLMYNLIDNITLQQIGDELGGRNHATIMHGIKKIYGLAGADTELLDSIYDLRKEIEKMEMSEI